MVRSSSNCRYDTFLDVFLIPSGPPGSRSKFMVSITTQGFPDEKIITVIRPDDQQLVEFEKILQEFIDSDGNEYAVEMAALLESMATKIRSRIKNNS